MDPDQFQHLRLLSATAQGDEQAFSRLYQSTSSKVYAVCLQMLQRRELAEDALQEAYVRVWHNAGDYQREKGTVISWLIGIARYRALDIMRARKSRRENSDEMAEEADTRAPDMDLVQDRDKAHIDDCMEQLEHPQRNAIQLAYFLGMTHQEVCLRLESPLGSVKSWIRRGLERLRRCLEV